MASAQSSHGPTPAPPSSTSTSTSSPTPEQLQSALDNSIWYLLCLWQPLHIAVSSQWGGPSSSDKRDWMAGAVSDLLSSRPDTDAEELGQFMVDIMMDEFDCNVEDDSELVVAEDILKVKGRMIEERSFDAAREVEERWRRRGTMKGDVQVQVIEHEVGPDEWEAVSEGDEDGDEDEEMEEAPQLVPAAPPKEKPAPEIDEDGFTKVVGKKKR